MGSCFSWCFGASDDPTLNIPKKKSLFDRKRNVKKKEVFTIAENSELERASEKTGTELYCNGNTDRQEKNLEILKENKPEIFELTITIDDDNGNERETTLDGYMKHTNLNRTMSYVGSMRSRTSMISRLSSVSVNRADENSDTIVKKDIFKDILQVRENSENNRQSISGAINKRSMSNIQSSSSSTNFLS
ncbi:unnamed protein product [Oikopleura dioica]|uniref:Uncharacterized protein n=1 Tax=Oikopleura dioica TaxID=34765 RepID=E4WRR4_OIKDI|nr:unnamed protein product [Oikopleura dioica]